MAHLVRLYQAHAHISWPAFVLKSRNCSSSLCPWIALLLLIVVGFKGQFGETKHKNHLESAFSTHLSSSGFKHSTLCCSFDTMSNNHEFYLDHKKRDENTQKVGPRRRPSTLNKCFSLLSALLPYFFYLFFCLAFYTQYPWQIVKKLGIPIFLSP